MKQKFKTYEQRKYGLYNILTKLTNALRLKIEFKDYKSFKYLAFFGHSTNFQNFILLYISEEKQAKMLLRLNFGTSLQFELIKRKKNFRLNIRLDDQLLDIKGCRGGICQVEEFLAFTD